MTAGWPTCHKERRAPNGGIMPMTEQHGDTPPSGSPTSPSPRAIDAVARARELGGEGPGRADGLGAGRIAVLADPQGAAFAFFEGETDD